MSMLKDEFLKAARETPRMFFAPLVGAIEAVWREFDDSAKKTDEKKSGKKVVIYPRSYRRFRKAAHKARVEAVKAAEKTV
ncbi:hypothetical protein SAMN04490189_1033 [Pseudomonas koreensis]|uniref:hypothetical protein n=1 Tax=Pseudomonas koreensis TaxID=198620 RepID=UPI00087DAB1E|nr:hypothetical protein [Pseudomonas koreensis]KAB0515785.1 hypothetical protein F7R05_00695 [Pseudomonas koreensis]NNA59869.1 hypothetical protein [Pseudomonas koreensis]GGK15075.1 hypothetical protein GCM10009103_07700 [Pseudomonas koreensis]SDC95493.1 hypothetical protein SAMN04490189_1033 [Pseudomonas koreensis]